ncbi:MAG: hypothetical protein QXK76_04180 [Candidatus Woesearchaeota archaeon]
MITYHSIDERINQINLLTTNKTIMDTNAIISPPIMYFDITENKNRPISTKHSHTWLTIEKQKLEELKEHLENYWDKIILLIEQKNILLSPTIKQELNKGIKITPKIINYIHEIDNYNKNLNIIKEILKHENHSIKKIIEITKEKTKEIENIILENYEKYNKILKINYFIQKSKNIESKNDYKIITEAIIYSSIKKTPINFLSLDYDMIQILTGIKNNIKDYKKNNITYLDITLYGKKNTYFIEKKFDVKIHL